MLYGNNTPQLEKEKPISSSSAKDEYDKNMADYQALEEQLKKDIAEFNESYKALQVWQQELKQRQEELKGLKATLDYDKHFIILL
jgi:inorganic pyrophosphatase